MVKAMCSEMGLKYEEMLNCTWLEFDYLQTGHNRRIERGWDYTRHLIASMYNSSGFAKQKVKADDIFKLQTLDNKPVKEFRKVPKDKVNELLKVMENG